MNPISNILNHPENGLLNGLSHLLKRTVLDSGKDGYDTGVVVLEREGDMLSMKGPSFNISMDEYHGGKITFEKISNLYEIDVEHGQESVPGLFTGSIDFTGKYHPLVSVLSHKDDVTPGDTITVHFQTLTENQIGQLSRELPLTNPSQYGALLNPQNQPLTEAPFYSTNSLQPDVLTVGTGGVQDCVPETILTNDSHIAAMRQAMIEHYSQVMGRGDMGSVSRGFGQPYPCQTVVGEMTTCSPADLNTTALSALAPGGGGLAASLENLPQDVVSHAAGAVPLAGAGFGALPFDSVPTRFLIVAAMVGVVIARKEMYRAKQKDAYLGSNLGYVGHKAREAAENTTRGFLTVAKKVTGVAHSLPVRKSEVVRTPAPCDNGLK